MKYYLYISDTKIDMLYPQIPHDQKSRIAKELKIDLKLISASFKEEKELKETRYSKAELVTKYIQNNCQVGTVDKPRDYIYDILEMKWGHYGEYPPTLVNSPLVFFGGKTDLTIFGMGGSAHHIIGSIGNPIPYSYSQTPSLILSLSKQLEIQQDDNIKYWFKHTSESASKPGEKEWALRAVWGNVGRMRGSSERLEFLAKTLLIGEAV